MVELVFNALGQDPAFAWRESGPEIRLRRISGGIGWPSKGRPGFLIVLGESGFGRDFPDVRRVHALVEEQDWMGGNFLSVPTLLEAVSDIQERYAVQFWNAEFRPEFYRDVREHNKKRYAQRKRSLRILNPSQDITAEWLAMRIYNRTAGQKTMFFHRAERTRAALSGLSRDLSEISWELSPVITALLMALVPLETRDVDGQARTSWTPADKVAGY